MRQKQSNGSAAPRRSPATYVGAVITLLICLFAGWQSARAGYASLLAEDALGHAKLDLCLRWAQEAVRLSPEDPEAYLARGAVLFKLGRTGEALPDYETAALLRPRDYLWQRLGYAHYLAGDLKGSVAPFREAVRRAPYYAQPRLMLGNSLLEEGDTSEAYEDLRRAVESNPSLLGTVIERVAEARGDRPETVEEVLRPQALAPPLRLAMAHYFVAGGNVGEAMRLYRMGGVPEDLRRDFLVDLIVAKKYREAYEVWSQGRPATAGGVTNGGFEERITGDEPGFGWQLPQGRGGFTVSLDRSQAHSGSQSLRVEFGGDVDPSVRTLSQLLPVEPGARYRLTFSARSQELVSGGLPYLVVADASGGEPRPLKESPPLQQGTTGWTDYNVEFVAPNSTTAVLISLQRRGCNGQPCPIFGQLWLDDFTLTKL